jgi:soluble lytic murein transglycosylase
MSGSWAGRLAAGMVLVPGVLVVTPSSARCQVYTRRNASGVVEATNVPSSPGFNLTYPGKGVVIHSRAYRLRTSYNGEYNRHIVDAAATHGVDINLVKAVIQVESDYDPLAVSSKGARGLMQLMPATAKRMGVGNAFDPRQNIFGGVRYLRLLIDMFQGNLALVAAAYNAGENAVARYGGIPPFKETQDYVGKVRSLLSGDMGPTVVSRGGPAFFAPNPTIFGQPTRKAMPTRPARGVGGRIEPAPPRTYYKWTDPQGVVWVSDTLPPKGITYSMIRALD